MKSWNEICRAATVFSKRWKGAYDEKSQDLDAAFGQAMDYVRALPANAGEIEAAAQAILDVREKYLDADPACTLAILYNSETMPPDEGLAASRSSFALGGEA